MREMPELFPGKRIGNMHFYHRCFYGFDGIANSYGGVGIGRGIKDDAVIRESHFLYLVNEFPFYVGLKIGELYLLELHLQAGKIVFKGDIPVNVLLPLPQQVQVRPVDDHDLHEAKCKDSFPKCKGRSRAKEKEMSP